MLYSGRLVFLIVASIAIAMLLRIIPLPHWAVMLRPEWLLLVIIYWVISLPERINLGVAWMCGLLGDVLNGNVLGARALAMLVVSYFALKLYRQFRVFSLWQQAFTVSLLTLLYEIILFLTRVMLGDPGQGLAFWLPAVASGLIWPWIFVILRDFHLRVKPE